MKPQLEFFHQRSRQRGQMAIFVALIFQVLFVLFAMAINVALVVHDKINLQNAVDLAAYYAAQRQAEMLNVIAHQNYTIRQSWKLLTWRYRALGVSGRDQHPWRVPGFADLDVPYDLPAPAVCITHAGNWLEVNPSESLCRNANVFIPPLPIVAPIAPTAFNAMFAAFSLQMRAAMGNSCQELSGHNWIYAMSILTAFRIDQRHRKNTIYALANNLSGGGQGDFVDFDGNSVRVGAEATFRKNLTYSNAESLVNFQLFNSLEGRPRQEWLNEIQIAPTMLYVDPSTPSGACVGTPQPINNLPTLAPSAMALSAYDPDAAQLVAYKDASVLTGGDYQYSMGVEKNPWIMAYMGVQAETAPRQIFFPFGNSISIRARAFAKPFGGRIGPWYGSRWTRSGATSTGTPTDQLLPPLANGFTGTSAVGNRVPNYSRFPGDNKGLRSVLAMAAIPFAEGQQSRRRAYENIWKESTGSYFLDPLALDFDNPVLSPMRYAEIAAIAPDLFDVTYYSIEPNFGRTYLPKLQALATSGKIGISNQTPVRGDLGFNPKLANPGFSVADQMRIHTLISQPAPLARPDASWFIRDKKNLLTGWTTGDTLYDFSNFPTNRFGQCAVTDDDFKPEFKVPGSCAGVGGRTGYSVRLVSREYLFSGGHPIGGTGESAGSIKNPPPSGW